MLVNALNKFFGKKGNDDNGSDAVGEPRKPEPVTLHIYDLGPAIAGVNMFLHAVGTGAFHAGVEVYGTEWSFGCSTDGPGGTGIFCVQPKGCTSHVYREGIPMGDTMKTKKEVKALIEALIKQWLGKDYDLLRRNCCHFSAEFCRQLSVGPVPSWVTSLAGVGAMLRSTAKLAVHGVAAAPGYALHGAEAVGRGAVQGACLVGGAVGDMLQPDASGAQSQGAKKPAGSEQAAQKKPSYQPSFDPPSRTPALSPRREAAEPGSGAGASETKGAAAITNAESSEGAWAWADMFGWGGQASDQAASGQRRLDDTATPARRSSSSDAPAEDSSNLSIGDPVEVFSNSHQTWCSGFVEALDGKMATVAFKLPGAGQERATKMLPIGHKNLRKGQADFAKGQEIEVFSNSQQAWCAGRVERISGQLLEVTFRLPGAGADEYSSKQVPIGHKSVRRPTERRRASKEADDTARQDAEKEPVASTDGQALAVGHWVEVYSKSHSTWCLGRVTQVVGSRATVVFQLPGSSIDEWVEQTYHQGSKDIRKMGNSLGDRRPQPLFVPAEMTAYGKSFRRLSENSAAGDLDASLIAEFIHSSGMPRKVLKEVWQVANPFGLSSFSLSEFSVCCRLIGHCQFLLSTGDPANAEVFAEGGDKLRILLESDLLEKPPPKLARFANEESQADEDAGPRGGAASDR